VDGLARSLCRAQLRGGPDRPRRGDAGRTTDAPGLLFDCSLVEAYGAGVVLNGQSGALELYAVDATGAATLAASAALPAGYCAAGGRYVIEAIKHRLSWSMSVTRESDGARVDYAWSTTTPRPRPTAPG
jgi:hypothetical protein